MGTARMLELLRRTRVPVYWHEAYRPPLTGIELTGVGPRRAQFALPCLLETKTIRKEDVRTPTAVSFEQLARVHSPEYLESLLSADTRARIFSVKPSDVP